MSIKNFFLAFLIGVLIVIGAGASCSNQDNDNSVISTGSVTIKNLKFNPTNISITKGTVVVWTNEDTQAHQIESDGSLQNLLSGELQKGEDFVFTFSQTGTFTYHCKLHPEMKGQVVVN